MIPFNSLLSSLYLQAATRCPVRSPSGAAPTYRRSAGCGTEPATLGNDSVLTKSSGSLTTRSLTLRPPADHDFV